MLLDIPQQPHHEEYRVQVSAVLPLGNAAFNKGLPWDVENAPCGLTTSQTLSFLKDWSEEAPLPGGGVPGKK